MEPYKRVLLTTSYIRDNGELFNRIQANVVHKNLEQPVIFDAGSIDRITS